MDRIGKLLPRVLARQPSSGRVVEMRVGLAFAELLGPGLAAECETIELHGSAITVVTRNPALAHQLRLDSELLLQRLNAANPGRRIRDIRVRSGR